MHSHDLVGATLCLTHMDGCANEIVDLRSLGRRTHKLSEVQALYGEVDNRQVLFLEEVVL